MQHSLRLRVSAIQLCFQTGLPSALRSALQYAVIALCVVVPWTIRTWVLTGNPVYPMLYNLFGGREWTAEGWPRLQFAFLLYTSLPGLEPVRANLLLARALLVGAALLLAVWVFRATRGSPLALPARFAAVVSPLLLLGSGYNLRFLLPAYPCVALCAASVFRGRDKRLAPVVCLLALLLAVRVGGSGLKPDLRTAVSVALGQTSREEYLQGVLTDYRVVEFANRNLPSDARILVGTWEEDTAYYRASTLRANYWLQDSVHYDSPARLEADLNRLDVQYLVYKPMEAAWCLRSYICRGRMETETRALGDLARRRGTKLFESNGVALFHLDLR